MDEVNIFINFFFILAYFLPGKFYGEQISLALEGPFLNDVNESEHQMTLMLLTNSDVSFNELN